MTEPTVVNSTNTTELNLAQSSENSSSATAVTLSKDNHNLQWTLIIIIKTSFMYM